MKEPRVREVRLFAGGHTANSITGPGDLNLSKLWETVEGRGAGLDFVPRQPGYRAPGLHCAPREPAGGLREILAHVASHRIT